MSSFNWFQIYNSPIFLILKQEYATTLQFSLVSHEFYEFSPSNWLINDFHIWSTNQT